jgi:HlyD family secretion protein
MLRRIVPLLVTVLILGAFGFTLYFLYEKSKPKPTVFETATPRRLDIVKKTVAPGAIVPRREVAIKPRVSGVIQRLHVEPGTYVEEQQLLAKIRVIPDAVRLNNAEAAVRAARISQANTATELERSRNLFEKGLLSEAGFNQAKLAADLRQQELDTARSNLQLVREGASQRAGAVSNMIYSTVAGMVLEVPVKEGGSVIEANNFNEGTTIASIADMNDLVFNGKVDESEVGKLKEGMKVSIAIGALGDRRFAGVLEYIAPKGIPNEGTIQFEVRARIELKKDVFIRANYSANADIILEKKEHVLAIPEGLVEYEGDQAFVEVEVGPQVFERRAVKLGLSDGIDVEVRSGIDEQTKLKVPEGTKLQPSS